MNELINTIKHILDVTLDIPAFFTIDVNDTLHVNAFSLSSATKLNYTCRNLFEWQKSF